MPTETRFSAGPLRGNPGVLHIQIPAVSESVRAKQIERATAEREASARRAVAAAGLTAPAPKPRQPAKAARSTSATVPITQKAKPRHRGPSNRGDFPFFQRRDREAQHRRDLRGGNYLAAIAGPLERTPTAKYRPATALKGMAVTFNAETFQQMCELVQAANGEREVAGSLFGYITSDRFRVIIATGPSPTAEATKTSIRGATDQATVDQIKAEHPGMREFSWHSHPHGMGEPSQSDIRALIADKTVMDIARPLMIILRPDLTYGWSKPQPACWALVDSDDPSFDYDVVSVDVTT